MFAKLRPQQKEIVFERTFDASIEDVWSAWTDAEKLKQWWGPENTFVPECEIDPRVGGRIYIVMEAGEGMGKYAGTRWPLEGTFTHVEAPSKFVYTAKSWTEGEKQVIDQVAEMSLKNEGGKTVMNLTVTIHKTELTPKMAVFGLKMGYKAHFKKLAAFLAQ